VRSVISRAALAVYQQSCTWNGCRKRDNALETEILFWLLGWLTAARHLLFFWVGTAAEPLFASHAHGGKNQLPFYP